LTPSRGDAVGRRAGAPVKAVALFIGTIFVFTLLDAVAKYLVTSGYPVLEAIWARYIGHLILIVALAPFFGFRRLFRTSRPVFQAARAFIMLAGTVMFVSALRLMPLADAYAISYVSPLIVIVLAAWLLRERVGPRRGIAVVVGFLGVLIAVQPGGVGFHWAMLLPLGMATSWALFQVMTRALSNSDDPAATLFFTGLIGTLAASLPLPLVWVTPTATDVLLFALLGVLGLGSHAMLVRAHALAPASLLAPFNYVQLPWSVLLGYVLFQDFPAVNVFVGAALILGSGFYVLWRHCHEKLPRPA